MLQSGLPEQPTLVKAFVDVGSLSQTVISFPVAIVIGATAIAIWRSGIAPRWWAQLDGLAALCVLVSGGALVAKYNGLLLAPIYVLLTILGALLIWFTVVPALKFLFIDAVWTGGDRSACLAENPGHPVGACWPYIGAKFTQFIYGFYPEPERWRVNLTFALAALLLLPLLIPKLPAKSLNAGLFFIAFPVVAFFLLHGGGLNGFVVSWLASLSSSFADSVVHAGDALIRASSSAPVIGHVLWLVGKLTILLGSAVSLVLWPLNWLRDQIQSFGRPVWIDLAITTVVVSALAFVMNGGVRAGWRPLILSLATFACIAAVI